MRRVKQVICRFMILVLLLAATADGVFMKTSEEVYAQENGNIPGTTISYEYSNGTLRIFSTNTKEMPDYTSIEKAPWSGLSAGVTKIVIKSSITHIGEWAFAGFQNLAEVEIDDPSLTSIGANAFYNCRKLAKINLPDSVSEIGVYAFANCDSLVSTNGDVFEIPEGIHELEECAFYQCLSLQKVELPSQLSQIYDGAFAYCENLEFINLEDTIVTEIGDSAFLETGVIEIRMPKTLTAVHANAFKDCDKLVSLTLSENLREVEEEAFLNCMALEEVQCTSQLETAEELLWDSTAFRGCDIERVYLFKDTAVYDWFKSQGYAEATMKELHIMSDENTNYSIQMNGEYNYTGTNICPPVQIRYLDEKLEENQDYTLIYSNNVNVGDATVVIEGKGAYSGKITKSYKIKACDLTGKGRISDISEQTYTGQPIEPEIAVTYGNNKLESGKDYTVAYLNNKELGDEAIVTVTGTGNYTGTLVKTFAISAPKTGTEGTDKTSKGDTENGSSKNEKTDGKSKVKAKSIRKCKIKVKTQIYTGKPIVPQITVKLGKKTLKQNKDYKIISCKNNKKVGSKATVKIQGINKYKGQKSVKFKINPPKAKLVQKGNYLTVKNYCKGADLLMEISHDGKVIKGTVSADNYKLKNSYSLAVAKKLYKGQKIKIRVKLSKGKKMQGKWSKWLSVK